MSEKTKMNELDALKAEIKNLREEIAVLTAGYPAGSHAELSHAAARAVFCRQWRSR
jgi:hypothetical protein